MQGITDSFGELCRKIESGVENMADESMGAIIFWIIPKVHLLHYTFVSMYTNTLKK